MNTNLFRLALERLEPSDWAQFELLCSAFLAPEFATLRTMASPSGDGGRDSELFSPENRSFIAAQYSVTTNWKSKVRHTVKRLEAECPDVRILVYMSNQLIGAQADDLKSELLEGGLSLDIRDRNWFIERAVSGPTRENAALELIDRIARPYLAGENIINKPTSPLSSNEARAALLYLGLQWQDESTNKGLTKLSFDALVRAALRHTSSESRMTRTAVHDAVCSAVPASDVAAVIRLVDSTLKRLTKRYVRHWQKEDEFCLTYEEHQRILSRLADAAIEEGQLKDSITSHCEKCFTDIASGDKADRDDLAVRVPRVIERFLLRRGESFVEAVMSDHLTRVGFDQLDDIILADIDAYPPTTPIVHLYPRLVTTILRSLFARPDRSLQLYLRRLASSYTLLSFLKQTPDVQSATRKLFSHGTIWIDTTVLLPVFAEQLEQDEARRFSKLLLTCRDLGVELRVTTGVIQEINAHMNNATACSRHTKWQGRIPYLYYQYLETGQPSSDFGKWIALFRGPERPDDDLAQYLADEFGIVRQDLGEMELQIDDELRWAADRLWSEAHKTRRSGAQLSDESTTHLLIKHDIETYLGVMALRRTETVTELGYRHWLLTLDRIAWEIRDKLKEEFKDKVPPSPLMSMSYLLDSMTREEHEGMPEYVIRRKVRDAIDRARRRRGCLEP